MVPSFQSFMIVALGGALGSAARYAVALIATKLPMQLPFGTFAANIVGCLFIGIFSQLASEAGIFSPGVRLFLMVGFCGGFTTFSTFALELHTQLEAGDVLQAVSYAGASVVLGVLALLAGVWITKAVL
ncbi:MAG: fluoride efflux transporter CrcB [Candidatus Kapaibacterium sp.]